MEEIKMGKISPVSAKYVIHANIQIQGSVDKPDVIGAIFGQTEGLLGSDLELRELQRTGKVARIEVRLDIKEGKTSGEIIIPCSMDKAETAVIAASLETIERIGPCDSRVRVEKLEDIRISKRDFVINRAKELLAQFTKETMPDSQELTEEVAQSVRVMEITEYGKDRLPAGPDVEKSEEIIVTEGRADVLNLLKNGIKNVVAINGTNVPPSIIELCKQKIVTAFVDGDRGGDLILRELMALTDIDFIAKAPDGKEIEELQKKEIFQALRNKVAAEQVKMDLGTKERLRQRIDISENRTERPDEKTPRQERKFEPRGLDKKRPFSSAPVKKLELGKKDKTIYKEMLGDLVGTRGAYLLDKAMNILGKVPSAELISAMNELTDIYAVILDGAITKELAATAERHRINIIIGTDNKLKPNESRVNVITASELN